MRKRPDVDMKNATGKDKKKKELERVVALGGKAPKSTKMPYNIMMAIEKKGAQRLEKRVIEEKASGVVHGKKLQAKVSRRPKSDAGAMATPSTTSQPTLKVMRLYKPRLCIEKSYRREFALSNMLLLPDSFGYVPFLTSTPSS
ncbi:hypothetical protein DYB32_008333 [Aphanomyces invadans]|uniref:Uncharacterized protein n=1 Tax=Aphanomyces invadans TaxID=157072 RepID=A0A3R6YU27_9STRA|nr:hypothetical protein DYB32_008333 [Aphanomyces invadans]